MGAPSTGISVPLRVTVTGLAMGSPEFASDNWPAGTGRSVGPKPVPQNVMVSPGCAGTVVVPENVPFLAA
jgi:hypothetical protein